MSPMLILGIESSCDETGIALYSTDNGGALLSHALQSQILMDREYGGVVPELASRKRKPYPVTGAATVLLLKSAHSADVLVATSSMAFVANRNGDILSSGANTLLLRTSAVS